MLEPKKEMTPLTDFARLLGLDYETPKSGIENIQETLRVVPAIRDGINQLMSL